MAGFTQSVNTFSDYGAEQQDIERKRRMAELLQQQAIQPIEANQMAGGYVLPVSWTQGLAKMLQSYSGAKGQEKATQAQKDLYNRQQQVYSTAGENLMKAVTPRPAVDATQGMIGASESGLPMETQDTAAKPAYNPTQNDLMAAQMKYTSDIGRTDLGAQFAMTHAQQAMLANALLGGQNQTALMPQAGSGTPSGDMANTVSPTEARRLLLIDPSGKLLAQEQSKRFAEQGKPVVNRGFGIGTMVNGQYMPDQASLDQALQLKRGEAGISQPFESPITLKTTSGQEIQLSRPEWVQYQQTKQLPTRITGQVPASIPPQDAQAFNTVRSASALGLPATAQGGQTQGLGIPGVSQSQPEQVQQAEQMSSAQSFGKGMGEVGTKIFTDGAASANALPQLKSMEQMGSTFEPGKLTPLKQSLGQWAIATGLMNEADAKNTFGNIGNMQALTSATTRLAAVSLRQSDGNPAVKQLELMLEAMPNKGQTPEGFALTMRFMQAAEQMKITKMQEAAAYLRQPGKQGDFSGFEDYWSKKVPSLQQQIYGAITPPAGATIPQAPVTSQSNQIERATSKSGKPMHKENGQWVYD